MPYYEAGEHKVDHPPLFACREHKQFLRLRASFIDDMVKALEDMVPSNLHEIAAPYVNGDLNAFKLPEYLIPPRVLIYNPDGLRGASALPFTLVFIDKRFIGIPAAYLTASRFEGCQECAANPPPEPPRRPPQQQRPPAPAKASPGASGFRPAVSSSGPIPKVQPPASPNPNRSGPIPAPPRPGQPQPPPPQKRPSSESDRRPVPPPPRPPQR